MVPPILDEGTQVPPVGAILGVPNPHVGNVDAQDKGGPSSKPHAIVGGLTARKVQDLLATRHHDGPVEEFFLDPVIVECSQTPGGGPVVPGPFPHIVALGQTGRQEFGLLRLGRFHGTRPNHVKRHGVVDRLPNRVGRILGIEGSIVIARQLALHETLRLVVPNPHGNPAPPRIRLGVVAALDNRIVLNQVITIPRRRDFLARLGVHLENRIARIHHRVRIVHGVKEGRLVGSALRPRRLAGGEGELIQDGRTGVLKGGLLVGIHIEAHNLVPNVDARHGVLAHDNLVLRRVLGARLKRGEKVDGIVLGRLPLELLAKAGPRLGRQGLPIRRQDETVRVVHAGHVEDLGTGRKDGVPLWIGRIRKQESLEFDLEATGLVEPLGRKGGAVLGPGIHPRLEERPAPLLFVGT